MSPAVTNGSVYLMFTGGARSRDRRLCNLPVLWAEQRRVLGFDAENAGLVSLAGRNFPPGFRASEETVYRTLQKRGSDFLAIRVARGLLRDALLVTAIPAAEALGFARALVAVVNRAIHLRDLAGRVGAAIRVGTVRLPVAVIVDPVVADRLA